MKDFHRYHVLQDDHKLARYAKKLLLTFATKDEAYVWVYSHENDEELDVHDLYIQEITLH